MSGGHRNPLKVGLRKRNKLNLIDAQESSKTFIQKHSRYLSKWEDDIVTINVAHHSASAPDRRTFDLSKIYLAAHGGFSIYKGNVPLSEFPHLVLALKHVINLACENHDKGDVGDQVTRAINDCLRVFVWMIRKGIYRLSDIKRIDTDELGNRLRIEGWWKTLDYELSLLRLSEEGKSNSEKMTSILGTGRLTVATVDCQKLSQEIGLPIPSSAIPNYFMSDLATYSEKKFKSRKQSSNLQASESSFSFSKKICNWLSILPDGVDHIQFLPFPKKVSEASKPISETQVLFLGDAVNILKESLKWIYDYAPGIIDLCNQARSILENRIALGYKDIRVELDVAFELDQLERDYGIPIQEIKNNLNKKTLTRKLVEHLQTAVICVIAFVHARRRGELANEHRNYGLYFGCIQDENAVNGLKRIDIYIEKSVQDYVNFWCNSLVADSVYVLEELSQCFRPLFSPSKKILKDITEARKDHLFVLRNFTVQGFRNRAECYRFSASIKDFLGLAGVPPYALNGAKAFRRLFAILYVHRYDHPVLLALKQHLCHANLSTTTHYGKSPKVRKEAEQIEKLFKRQFEKIEDAISEVRREYFNDLLLRMLKGEEIGGAFPQFINKVLKKISANINFHNNTEAENLHYAQKIFAKHGFFPYEMEHGACMAGDSHSAIKRGKCCIDEKLHRETASPHTCHGCPNNLNTNNYLSLHETERDRLFEESMNFSNSKKIRIESARQAQAIDKLILSEKSIAEKNKATFQSLFQTWGPIFMKGQEHEFA